MRKIKDTKLNHTLNVAARWLVGVVFLFSSFVKGVDPLGTTYKVQEYMTAWSIGNWGFEWALPLAEPLSVILICAEFLVGILLITNAYRLLSAWLLVLMMVFFTGTTLVDAITNKVTDCGCFGDAIKLTNWQTFWKNIVLDVPTVWIFLTRRLKYRPRFERDGMILLTAVLVMTVFELYNIKHEPLIDFRPWKIGNQMMDIHNTEAMRSYLVYQNKETGEEEKFESAQLMDKINEPGWTDKWEWKESIVIDPNEIAAPGFSMLDLGNEDHATELLPAEDGMIICTIHDITKVDQRGEKEVKRAIAAAEENGVRIVLLTSALPEEIQQWLNDQDISGLDYLFAESTAIKTMMRGNPGFMYIKDATVVSKGRKALNVMRSLPSNSHE